MTEWISSWEGHCVALLDFLQTALLTLFAPEVHSFSRCHTWLGWDWGLDALAHPSATILWPRVTCFNGYWGETQENFQSLWILLNFNKNKVGYTATLVVCGRAGAVFELLEHLGKCSEAKDRKNIKKVKWGPTNQPTYRWTKQGVESRSTWLKMIKIRKKLPYNHLFECQMGELIRAEYDNIRFEFPKCPGRYLEQIWYPNFSNLLDFY